MNRFFLVLFKVPPPFQDTIKYGLGHTCKSLPIIITTLSFSCHLLIAFPIEVALVAYIRLSVVVSVYHCRRDVTRHFQLYSQLLFLQTVNGLRLRTVP